MSGNNFVMDKTNRGFALVEFKDERGGKCSLQKSSQADEDLIWLGHDKNAEPHLGEEMSPRMHLSRDHVRHLLPYLIKFANSGELVDYPDPPTVEESLELINAGCEQAKEYEKLWAMNDTDQFLAKIREDAERGDSFGTQSGGGYLHRYLESVGITPPKTTRHRLDDIERRIKNLEHPECIEHPPQRTGFNKNALCQRCGAKSSDVAMVRRPQRGDWICANAEACWGRCAPLPDDPQ